jgi:hypothetical protein
MGEMRVQETSVWRLWRGAMALVYREGRTS